MILAGLSGIILVEIYAAVMQREFQYTDNRVGKGFAILGIYLFVVAYCKSILVTLDSEIGKHTRSSERHKLTYASDFRWDAQQYDMALWGRNPPHCSPKQGHGSRCSFTFYRQRRE